MGYTGVEYSVAQLRATDDSRLETVSGRSMASPSPPLFPWQYFRSLMCFPEPNLEVY